MQRFNVKMAIFLILLACSISTEGCSNVSDLRINGKDRTTLRKSLDTIESSLADNEKMRFRLATIIIFNEARKLNPDDPNAGMRKLLGGKTYKEMIELSLQVGKKNFDTLNNRDKKIINDMVDNKDNYQADVLGRPDKDPNHIKKLSTSDIMGKYVKNAQAGQLFIVTGKLHNGYDSPIEQIQIRGELFVIGERLSQTEIVYAGIKINEHELSTTPVAEIKKRLRTIPQDKKESVKVLANQDLDFMIVFSDLPKGIDQFGVQPVFSAKVQ